jgi:hypothetical protein
MVLATLPDDGQQWPKHVKAKFFNPSTNFNTPPASGILLCVDFGGFVFVSRVGAKYIPR